MPDIRYVTISVLLLASAGITAMAQQTLTPVTVSDIYAENSVLYSLSENRVVADSLRDTDSWHVGFQSTSILVNGGAMFVEEAFENVVEAPADGYKEDDAATGTALPSGSGSGWYFYDMQNHVLTPVPNRTVVLKTASGLYAKLEVLSYYKGGDLGFGEPRWYSFRYALQSDGSTNLVTESCAPDDMECSSDE